MMVSFGKKIRGENSLDGGIIYVGGIQLQCKLSKNMKPWDATFCYIFDMLFSIQCKTKQQKIIKIGPGNAEITTFEFLAITRWHTYLLNQFFILQIIFTIERWLKCQFYHFW